MLMRFDPFRELDRLSQELWSGADRSSRGFSTMAMDAYREDDHFVVHFDLPGVDPESIDITVEDDMLTVSADRKWERREAQEWVATERYRGTYQRQLFLGDRLDADHIEATYDEGVLTLTIPVAEAAKPRKVAVQAGKGQQAIDTSSEAA